MSRIKRFDIYFVGNFGSFSQNVSGQITKTRELYSLFSENGNLRIDCFDVDILRSWSIGQIWKLFTIARARHVIYLPALNNLKYLFPILYLISIAFGFKVHYFVVGGWLPKFIRRHWLHMKLLKRISRIYVETDYMNEHLTQVAGFRNVVWFPNFRNDKKIEKSNSNNHILRLVFLSRITLDKGVDTIFHFLDSIINTPLFDRISIDFFGPVDQSIREWFDDKLSTYANARYCGIVSSEKVQSVLSNYDCMLFPTRYPGEGCPGVIVEALMASLPVIASDWRYNKEYVLDGETGYLFPPMKYSSLNELIRLLESDRFLLKKLSVNARRFSEKFTSVKAWEIIKTNIELE